MIAIAKRGLDQWNTNTVGVVVSKAGGPEGGDGRDREEHNLSQKQEGMRPESLWWNLMKRKRRERREEGYGFMEQGDRQPRPGDRTG
jgi:hypothetical protein